MAAKRTDIKKANGDIAKMKLSPSEELKILRKIVEITNSQLDLDIVLKDIVRIVTDMTGADSVFIYLFDDDKKNLTLKASKTPHKKELGKIKLKVGEGITGWVAKERKPVFIKSKAYDDPRFKSFDVLPEDKYESFLATPIVYKTKAIGVINVQHKSARQYTASLIKLIASIAQQVGGVIENARLYYETKQKALQVESIVKISESIISEKYLDEILDLIVVVTAEMLHSKICSIMLIDETRKNLMMTATHSLSEEYKKKPPVKLSQSLSGEVIRNEKPRAVYDVTKEEKYMYRDLARKEGLNSMLIVPMIVKDKAIGVVNVYTTTLHEFTKEEINALQIIAHQAAVAIENTRLMDEALKVREALETRKMVERAKGILMESNTISENAAYKLIRKKSMDSCRSMKEVAEAIVLTADLAK
ncbi:GAF domain-containing protein [Candidatus Omnitrophota bacterium]